MHVPSEIHNGTKWLLVGVAKVLYKAPGTCIQHIHDKLWHDMCIEREMCPSIVTLPNTCSGDMYLERVYITMCGLLIIAALRGVPVYIGFQSCRTLATSASMKGLLYNRIAIGKC